MSVWRGIDWYKTWWTTDIHITRISYSSMVPNNGKLYVQVRTSTYLYIPVYTGMYQFMPVQKNLKNMHNYRNWTDYLMHSFRLTLPLCSERQCISVLQWFFVVYIVTVHCFSLGQHPAPPCSDSTEGPGSSSIAHHDVFLENLLHDQYIPVYTSTYHFWSVHLSMYMYILVCTCTYYILLFGTMLLYEILVIWMSVVHQVLYKSIPLHTDIYLLVWFHPGV